MFGVERMLHDDMYSHINLTSLSFGIYLWKDRRGGPPPLPPYIQMVVSSWLYWEGKGVKHNSQTELPDMASQILGQ